MKCAKCGTNATIYNKDGIPMCSRHSQEKVSAPLCPECNGIMAIRKSKYGSFWGCQAFPMCDGIKKF
ncbi:MAG: topoisomerase DNA-binding C4 zinc finger domain-containing protein [archaeon]|jgi:ssDNA-binding Zn-finger/Zn-ribbon topoisomerase 1